MVRQLVVLGVQGSEIRIQRGNSPEMRQIDSGKTSGWKGCITYIVININCDIFYFRSPYVHTDLFPIETTGYSI